MLHKPAVVSSCFILFPNHDLEDVEETETAQDTTILYTTGAGEGITVSVAIFRSSSSGVKKNPLSEECKSFNSLKTSLQITAFAYTGSGELPYGSRNRKINVREDAITVRRYSFLCPLTKKQVCYAWHTIPAAFVGDMFNDNIIVCVLKAQLHHRVSRHAAAECNPPPSQSS